MNENDILIAIKDLKQEHAYFFDLWKNSGPSESGSLMNKIKDIERKIAELEKMNKTKVPANSITNEYDIPLLVQQNKILEALDCLLEDKQRSDLHNTYILLKSQYNDIESQRNQNLISFDEYKREKARIVNAILNLK